MKTLEHNVCFRKDLEEFLAAAREYDITAYTYFKLLSSTGLRRSEALALALTWKDIDLTKNTLSVNRTLAYELNSKTIMQTPKSKISKRILPISTNLHEDLIDYQKSQKIIYKYLFHGANGKLTWPAQWLNTNYRKNPNLRRTTIHGFKHTFATLLISEINIKPKTVQMLMGHEDIKRTLDIYTYLYEKNKIDTTNSIRELNI